MKPKRTILTAALLLGGTLACVPPTPLGSTLPLRTTHSGISSFHRTTGRLPADFQEVCALQPSWCGHRPAEWARDRWGGPLRYRPEAIGYVLTSAGRDRRFDTPDDIVLDATLDRRWAESIAGCYVLSPAVRRLGSDTLHLSAGFTDMGNYVIDAPKQVDGHDPLWAEWYPLSAESLVAMWMPPDHGVVLEGRVVGANLEFGSGRRKVFARRVDCGL